MAEITFVLKHGLKVGEDTLTDVVMRELTAGDVLGAKEESEKLCHTVEGPVFVTSPTLMGANVLRRQIVRIGDMQGPLSLHDLRRLHTQDFVLLQRKADELDAAFLNAAEALRSDAGGR